MKKTRKLWAFLLAMIMVLAMGMSAMAADTGSITVDPANDGQTYTLYKLFDAEITLDGDDLVAINYKLPAGKNTLGAGAEWFEIQNGYVVAKADLQENWAKDPDAIAWAKSFGTPVLSAIKATEGVEVKWENLDYGYYYVDSTLGSFVGVDSAAPNATIQDKNNPPTIDKEIESVDGDANAAWPKGDEENARETAIAEIGDIVNYKITVLAKPGAEKYVVKDTLDVGLTPPVAKNVNVSVDGVSLTDEQVKVNVTDQVITVTFEQTYLDTIEKDTPIVIKYSSKLNNKAVVGNEDSNDNKVVLTWGHDTSEDSVNKTEDEVKVYSAKVDVSKYYLDDGKKIPLQGAEFMLKNSEGKFYKYSVTTGVSWVTDTLGMYPNKATTDENGKITDVFKGLKAGTYTLVETVVPEGFNKIEDIEITITTGSDECIDVSNLVQVAEVENKAGAVLPSTGGMGTTIFYVAGGALVLAAVVLLVTRKRMSVEK